MDALIDNKNYSKKINDSLTFVRKNIEWDLLDSPAVTCCVFWLPLSWIQCCDIFFSIKQFIQEWIICWDKKWFDNNIFTKTDWITNIEINKLKIMIDRIKVLIIKNEDDDKQFIGVFESIISQIENTLTSVSSPLQKLNNFIDFYVSIFKQGMYVHLCVLYTPKFQQ